MVWQRSEVWLCEGWWEYLTGLLQAVAVERRGQRSRTLRVCGDVIVLRTVPPAICVKPSGASTATTPCSCRSFGLATTSYAGWLRGLLDRRVSFSCPGFDLLFQSCCGKGVELARLFGDVLVGLACLLGNAPAARSSCRELKQR
jgi:hypothetical protein